MLVLTWIPSRLRPFTMEKCVASLIWWAAPWSDIGIFIASVLIGLYIITAVAIAYQLFRTPTLDREERIAASRTVYYLAVGTIMMVGSLSCLIVTANGLAGTYAPVLCVCLPTKSWDPHFEDGWNSVEPLRSCHGLPSSDAPIKRGGDGDSTTESPLGQDEKFQILWIQRS
jgi:hypothetical protein